MNEVQVTSHSVANDGAKTVEVQKEKKITKRTKHKKKRPKSDLHAKESRDESLNCYSDISDVKLRHRQNGKQTPRLAVEHILALNSF